MSRPEGHLCLFCERLQFLTVFSTTILSRVLFDVFFVRRKSPPPPLTLQPHIIATLLLNNIGNHHRRAEESNRQWDLVLFVKTYAHARADPAGYKGSTDLLRSQSQYSSTYLNREHAQGPRFGHVWTKIVDVLRGLVDFAHAKTVLRQSHRNAF